MAEILNSGIAAAPAAAPVRRKSNSNNSVPITDILYRTLHYWPWLLLSVVVCVGLGVIYLLRTPNVYTTTASILIKDESAGKSAGAEDFGDFGLFQNKTNIQNEITTLKSADLMADVVRRLHLDMNYYRPGRFHDVVAYGTTLPVTVSLPELAEDATASFSVEVAPDGAVTVDDFKAPSLDIDGETFKGALNDTIATPAGPLVVAPTKYLAKGDEVSLKVVKTPLVATAASYDARLNVAMSSDKGTVINLTVTDQSTQRAQDLINTLIAVYNEYWIRDKNLIAVSTSNFINERLAVIESELGNVDSDISSYKSQHLIPDVAAASSMYMSQNQQISQEILALTTQLQLTRFIKNSISSGAGNDKLLPANSGVENGNIQSQINEYNDLVLQRNSLIAKSSDKNPLVIQLDGQLEQVRQAMLATVDNSILALTTQLKSLQGTQATTTSKIASNPTQAKYLLSVERQQKVKESLYLFLLQKREENELSQAFTAYNTRIVNKPASFGPTSPDRATILLVAFLIGLALPVGVIFLKEANNTKVRGRKDVDDLAAPFLGEIPQHAAGTAVSKSRKAKGLPTQGEKHPLVVKEAKRDIINEAFRVLRTNVEFMCGSTPGSHNVIAVTSFNPGSGKSFITVNLAMSIALKGKRVLVIDGDMRHGSTSAYFGKPQTGISAYLSGSTDNIDAEIITSPDCRDLSILPVGAIPPNPTELLESPRFGQLIDQLKPRYDYILIDCPPVEVVADAQIIDRHADRTFFIIRAGLLERAMLPELDRVYEERKYRNMAVILNGTRNDQGRYGYSHTYRYGYGYGYGYGYNYGTSNPDK
ncbi:MAG: polysaccharide biosynthesis tyrosine autokinase [Bacteroides sp.]|nr:polysaccharide biosynthesis tyrosine autokinase [Alistipes timonensis]MCM1310979.1 polysaccharide biosynthesis tyrosine autokinase [Bacteroides sp.]MCM1405146.1 polysaccharide biosynthesis tyrosine autokinase [[Clostridium] fimetarium]